MKQKQPALFDDTNALPIFSGVSQRGGAENFAPKEEVRQLQLFALKFEDCKKVKK